MKNFCVLLVAFLSSLLLCCKSWSTTVTIYNSSTTPWSYTFGWDEFNSGGGLGWGVNTPQFGLYLAGGSNAVYNWPNEAVGLGVMIGGSFTGIGGFAAIGGSYILPQPNANVYLGQGAGDAAFYTNYTVTVQNTLSIPGTATWTLNGTVVKTETLAPGASDSYTTPPVLSTQNFTLTGSISGNSTGVGYNADGTPMFESPSTGSTTLTGTGNSASTTDNGGTSTGTGNTNVFSPVNNDHVTPATNILYQTPSGTASESTLEAVGNILHSDLGSVVAGEDRIDLDLIEWSRTITNSLGQVVTQMLQASNNDAIPSVIAAITNLQGHLTATNVVTVSSGTNTFELSLTNYATSSQQSSEYSVLVGISNLLSAQFTNNSGTNFLSMTNGIVIDGLSALANANSAQSVAIGNITSMQGDVSGLPDGSDLSGGSPPVMDVLAGAGNTFHLDMEGGAFGSLWGTLKSISTYLLVIFYAQRIIVDLIKFFDWLTAPQGHSVPNMDAEVLGNGGNFAGGVAWLLATGVIMVLWAAGLALLFTSLFSGFHWHTMISTVSGNPFNSMDSGALHWLNAAFPLAFAMGLVVAYLTWLLSIVGIKLVYGSAMQWVPR